MEVVKRFARAAAIAALPVMVALLTAPVAFRRGSIVPWSPQMVDLDVYRFAGHLALHGGGLYVPSTERLPFLYPPSAALLAVPLSVVPQAVAQVAWLILCVAALLAVLHRVGLTGWVLSLVAAATVYFCEPVNQTLAYGQVGIVLVALVMLDLAPGPRLRRAGTPMPAGSLTGLATAIKLTPALFAVYQLLSGGRRAALGTIAAMGALSLAAAVVLPNDSLVYWSRLLHGDTGIGDSIIYLTNQSMLGSWLRITGFGGLQTAVGLALAASVAALGVYAAHLWHQRGKVTFAVTICGVAGLLASPVSWSHHFVWVVPLAVVLLDRELPPLIRVLGWVFVGWVSAAPFKRLPAGNDVELTYVGWQHLLASFTALLAAVFVVACVAGGVRRRPSGGRVDATAPPAAHPSRIRADIEA